jgi:hypothetical protein
MICFFQRGVALGGRSSGILRGAAACLRPAAGSSFPAAARAMRRTFSWRCGRKCGSNAGANFSANAQAVFFLLAGRLRKMAAEIWLQNQPLKLAPKDATYRRRDGFAAWLRTTWLPYVQRVPEICARNSSPPSRERYTAKHPPDADGQVHVRMVRLEIDAVKV